MRITIGRCAYCKGMKLVDRIKGKFICFTCKRVHDIRRIPKKRDILAAKDKVNQK